MIIKRIGPLSCAKIVGLLYAFLGFLAGGLLSLFSLAGFVGGHTSHSAGGTIRRTVRGCWHHPFSFDLTAPLDL